MLLRVRALQWRSRRVRVGLAAISLLLVAVGGGLLAVGLHRQVHAPQPPAAAAVPIAPSTVSTPSAPASVAPPPAAPAVAGPPISLDIPAIKVRSSLIRLGRNANGTVQVPPLSDVAQAGWYRYSPIPGTTGPAIILGHIDSAQAGKGVFFNLGLLRQGDIVTVLRADHMLATFSVTRVVETAKTAFSASAVYGNTVDPELRLITCGGTFDPAARSYEDNIIVFASLTSIRAT
jgi:sortase (surface protein transpeptidase)